MSGNKKKLFLLDAFALIYRAYFGFTNNHQYNSKGLNTSAVLGFTNTLIEILRKEKPTHIAVVFDAPATTIREVEFPEYKAGREAMPEDIRNALPYIKNVVKAFNIPILLCEGYEADDVIGTLAKEAERKGFTTYMMTPDKDFGQLVSENIFMYKPARSGKPAEILGVNEICEKFQIQDPLQVIDILGLWGDAVDNIPGIPGIGEKTSKILIAKYGSIEGLIANADELKGKQKENVINFAQQGLMSKRLATIILDAPVEFDEKELELSKPNKESIRELFSELEFRTLAQRVLGEDIVIKQFVGGQLDMFGQTEETNPTNHIEMVVSKTINDVKHDYQLIETPKQIANLAKQLEKSDSYCIDTETTGLNPLTADLVGMCFSFSAHQAYYVPVSGEHKEIAIVVSAFKKSLEDTKIEKIAHNLKYDYLVLQKYGAVMAGPLFDTMIAHYLFQPDMKHGMDALSESFLNYKPISIETLIGRKGKNQLNMKDLPSDKIKDYAAEDADVTFQLKELFSEKMEKGNVKKLFNDIEMPLTKVLADMEAEGINLDINSLSKFSEELGADIEKLHKKIIAEAGTEFNLDSPKQLGQILFEVLKVTDKPKKTKTGQYSTSEDVLSKLANDHKIIPNILDYRSLKKLKSTYVDALPALINPNTKKLHTTYMQTVAATGRLSSNNPNLQNIPIKTEKGREIRRTFIPRNKEFILLAADYSQIELRIIAALSEDENMQLAFVNKEDIHTATAAKVFGVKQNDVTREMRGKAKAVNFGIIYGQSAFGLSQNLNISRGEAKEIIESYFIQYPKIRTYMDKTIEQAKKNGYVETILGRRRYLKDINSSNAIVRGHAERNAVNAPIQGSAADIIKIAMINIHTGLKEGAYKSKMLLQVHDELVFDAHNNETDRLTAFVKDKMENAVTLSVPLDVEIGIGKNWLQAH
jgi:DNA polymerase I